MAGGSGVTTTAKYQDFFAATNAAPLSNRSREEYGSNNLADERPLNNTNHLRQDNQGYAGAAHQYSDERQNTSQNYEDDARAAGDGEEVEIMWPSAGTNNANIRDATTSSAPRVSEDSR